MVGFGKAVLGMAAAVEQSLGNHITTGLVSVPKGILETAVTSFPHYLLQSGSKIRYVICSYCETEFYAFLMVVGTGYQKVENTTSLMQLLTLQPKRYCL